MNTVEITLNLPEELVIRARKAGVLTVERMIALIEKELEREYHVKKLFKTLDQIQAVEPPLTVEDLNEEIRTYRAEKRAKRQIMDIEAINHSFWR